MYMHDNDWKTMSPYFNKSEFKCKCGKCDGYGKGIAKSLILTLNFIRAYYGKAITITSGYRCPEHDKRVGGTGSGNHTKGLAADFWFSNANKSEVISHLKKTPYYRYAYTNETNMKNGIHIDTKLIKICSLESVTDTKDTEALYEAQKQVMLLTDALNERTVAYNREVNELTRENDKLADDLRELDVKLIEMEDLKEALSNYPSKIFTAVGDGRRIIYLRDGYRLYLRRDE